MTGQAFTDRLTLEGESLFVVSHGRRLWFSWQDARCFAYFESLIRHRKQSVHAENVDGRWCCWHVRVIPPAFQTDDGASAPLRADSPRPAQAGAATRTPAPSSPPVLRCAHQRGRWICASPPHRHEPERHFFLHQEAAS